MKKLIFLLSLASINSFSQKKFDKQFNLISHNDLYVSIYYDRYYTNGVFLSYNYLSSEKKETLHKKIYSIELGQQMYSPFRASVESLAEHDRPFAGYLFGSFGVSNFLKNESLLRLNGQIGVIGPSAFGQELMDFVHSFYGFESADGWKYQIQEAFALNISIEYIKSIGSSNQIDFNWKNKGNSGTVFADLSTGFLTRIGIKSLQSIANSIAFRSNINNDLSDFNNETEIFFYVNPMLRLAIYDATIQGSFLNDDSIVTYDINPLVLATEIGFQFTANRFNFKYAAIHYTKKLKSIRVPDSNFYGSIEINYLFN